ncbi:MAG: Gfo/Idh/MocA family protein [Kiloniellales bacterium]
MTPPKPLNALVIGCGRIAGSGAPTSADAEAPTHADAYDRHPSFRMTTCIEPDERRRLAFMRRWQVPEGFADLDACIAAQVPFDVASVCAPTPAHAAILWRLLETPVRAVLCEKPLTDDAGESARLVDAYRAAGKPLAVAYLRRWNPAMAELKRELENGDWGALRTATGLYTRGLLVNGSHLVDLIRYLFGPLALKAVTGKRIDSEAQDPTVDAVLALDGGVPVHLIAADSRDYALFELHLITERGAIGIERSGHGVRRRRIDEPFHPHHKLLDRGEWEECSHGDPYFRALGNLLQALENGEALASDGESALEAQRLCEEMIDKAKDL